MMEGPERFTLQDARSGRLGSQGRSAPLQHPVGSGPWDTLPETGGSEPAQGPAASRAPLAGEHVGPTGTVCSHRERRACDSTERARAHCPQLHSFATWPPLPAPGCQGDICGLAWATGPMMGITGLSRASPTALLFNSFREVLRVRDVVCVHGGECQGIYIFNVLAWFGYQSQTASGGTRPPLVSEGT